MIFLYILIFIISACFLYFAGELVIKGLMKTSRVLGLREFVVAFFVMAFASSLPNLFIGITSALRKIPELSFGDIAGNNLAAMTVAVALAVLFSPKKNIPAESQTVQTSSFFTIISAIMPLILILDGRLSRIDGVLLIGFFTFYIFWLFSKKERFTKTYDDQPILGAEGSPFFLKDLGRIILGIIILIASAQGIVASAQFFAATFHMPLILVGLLITGLGGALPEIYFGIASAKKGETWMILGNTMGAVVIPATLVLGIVALIYPIQIFDFSSFAIARFFLIISAFAFIVFIKTSQKITQKEAVFLIFIYLAFVISEILLK